MLTRYAFRNLWRNPRRSITILLAVGLGMGAIFLYHGFNFGIMNQYKENSIRCRYGHGQINSKDYLNQTYEKPWEHWITDIAPLRDFLLKQKEVQYVFPRVSFFALLSNGQINVSGQGLGIDAPTESAFFTTMNITEGKMLSVEENGVILGTGLAKGLGLKVGDTVTVLANTVYGSLNGLDLQVVGIFHTGMKEFDDRVFRLPLAQAQTLLDTTNVESVSIGLKKGSESEEDFAHVMAMVQATFPHLDITPFADLDKVYYKNSMDFLAKQFDVIRIIILTIVLLSIFNTVSTSILERRHEIGNLRANGESASDVLKLLALEGLFLGLQGGALGIGFAYILNWTALKHGILMPPAPGITRQFHVMVELQFLYGVKIFILGIVTVVLATLLAALKVVRERITDLLRSH